VGFLRRLARYLRPPRDRYNLHIQPHYEIKASARNPYFQALEAKARATGYLGEFVVEEEDGTLRPGTNEAVETRHALLSLDAYPNPAAIEGRTVADYATPEGDAVQPGGRRTPRLTVVLDDESELFIRRTGDVLRVEEPAPRFRR